MSTYTLVAKEKNNSVQSNALSLLEYMLYHHNIQEDKFTIFKLANASLYEILKAEFEVIEFDEEGEVIATSLYHLENLDIRSNQSFVPLEKYIVRHDCVKVSYRLIKAYSKDYIWEDGSWSYTNESQVETTQKTHKAKLLKTTYYQTKFPYFISITLVAVFVIIVLLVFNAINR